MIKFDVRKVWVRGGGAVLLCSSFPFSSLRMSRGNLAELPPTTHDLASGIRSSDKDVQ